MPTWMPVPVGKSVSVVKVVLFWIIGVSLVATFDKPVEVDSDMLLSSMPEETTITELETGSWVNI